MNYREWPKVMIVATATDGITSMWGLDACELFEALPESPKSGGKP